MRTPSGTRTKPGFTCYHLRSEAHRITGHKTDGEIRRRNGRACPGESVVFLNTVCFFLVFFGGFLAIIVTVKLRERHKALK